MPDPRVKAFIKSSFHVWRTSFLISISLAVIILATIFVLSDLSSEPRGFTECSTDYINHVLNLIPPVQLGVVSWQIGDYAQYQYTSKLIESRPRLEQYFGTEGAEARLSSRDVKFHIIAELPITEQKSYWMLATGLDFFKAVPNDIYRLVSPAELRITPETPRFDFVRNYVPLPFKSCQQASLGKLIKLDDVELQTPAGRFKCVHYRVEFGADDEPVEIWANPKILPLGIVRINTPRENLELISYGRDTEFNIPEIISPLIQGISKLGDGCTSCHGSDNCHEIISPPR